MAQQDINVGAAPNDGTGDPLRTAYIKCNDNFGELYSRAQTNPPTSLTGQLGDVAGMYAYDQNYFYYCYQDFDGSSVIWNEVSQIGNVSISQLASGNSSVAITDINGNAAFSINGTSNVVVVSNNSVTVAGGISATGNINSANIYSNSIQAVGLISATGTITGAFFVGNGSALTGITTSYNNSNVASYLPTYTGSFPILNGLVSTSGNISGAYILGNGSQLTGIPASYTNSNVATFLSGSVGNIIPAANVTYNLGNSTNQWKDLWVSNATIYMNSVPVTLGSGNILSVGGQPVLTNNSNTTVSTTGNITGNYIFGNGSQLSGIASSYGNANVAVYLPAYTGNLSPGNIATAGIVSAVGNVSGSYILGNGSQLTGIVSTYGNANVASYLTAYAGSLTAESVTASGNVSGGNVLTGGLISAAATITGGNLATAGTASVTGNITGGNVATGGLITAIGSVISSANIAGGNLTTVGTASAVGNIRGGNVLTVGIVSSTGNATHGNILTGGIISAAGNITGNYILGNGSQLTGITANAVSSANVSYVAPYTGSVSRTANSKFSDTVSVKDFGAVGNGVADDRAAIQAAIDTQKRVYFPEGTYRVGSAVGCYYQGQILYGDGRNKTIILADNINYSFNLSDTAVLVFTPGEPGPSLRDIGIQFVQPVTSNRASLVNYPPAIYAQNVPRFQIINCRITQGMTGIDMRQNSGGAIIDGLEMSCYNYGVRIDGSLDTVRILNMQYWPFDIAGTANESIFFDTTNRGVVSGRCDDLKINGCLFINGGIQLELQTTVNGTTFGACTDTDFDNTGSVSISGGNMNMVACYFTIGNAAYNPITASGGYIRIESCSFEAAVGVTNAMIQQSGSAVMQLTNNIFRNSGTPGGYFSMSAGTTIINGCQFVTPANQTWTNPLIAVAGGRMTFVNNRSTDKGTGAGNFIAVGSDNWHMIANNLGVGWNYSFPAGYSQMVVANNK